jgi:MinD-like ATPase involved in chromosome partitioning or flagellar assembly
LENLTRIIGIISGKGGVGKTTFAVNLGIALSRFRKRVLVVDCNVTTPHLAYYLGADDYFITLNNIFRGEVDERFAPSSHGGIAFLPASEELKDALGINVGMLSWHVKRLARTGLFDFIILDSAPGLGKEACSVMKAAEEILFVTTPTVPDISDVVRCYEYISRLKNKKISIVFNKVRKKKFELDLKNAFEFFEAPILGAIPFSEEIMDSTAQGIPIFDYRPNSSVCHCFMEVAANLIGVKYEKPSKIKRIFEKLKRKIRRR